MPSCSVVVDGMKGLGDNLFQRAFVKALSRKADVYLQTPWPELYEDIPRVRFLKMLTPLRTQTRNLARQPPDRWSEPPAGARRIRVGYGPVELQSGSMTAAMERCFGIAPESWDLPAELPEVRAPGRPIAMIRPATMRKEWPAQSRNPRPEYLSLVASELAATHYVVSVADLDPGAEWLDGEPPPAHERLHRGELSTRELLGLARSASVCVGGVGWIVPAAIAAGSPLFCILGGQGERNAPEKITDPRMELSRVGFAFPDRFCRCSAMQHRCDKSNSRIREQWSEYRRKQAI